MLSAHCLVIAAGTQHISIVQSCDSIKRKFHILTDNAALFQEIFQKINFMFSFCNFVQSYLLPFIAPVANTYWKLYIYIETIKYIEQDVQKVRTVILRRSMPHTFGLESHFRCDIPLCGGMFHFRYSSGIIFIPLFSWQKVKPIYLHNILRCFQMNNDCLQTLQTLL